ncbi:hypothetical protein HPB49_012953 [Dermacentor silvarum]|uniref:Uncharacterized protein n=1 Tax=Dermacentor silvarum TaxID=543639 RepID=A0ACB8D562_DERSI|nr:hypothetical protein HPB49_012953 [Dermacentor silvarum]
MAPTSAAVSVVTATASSLRGIMCRRLAALLFTLSLLAVLDCAPSDAAATAASPQHEDAHQTQASKFTRWSRATNTRERLNAALSGDQPVFLEADVVLVGGLPVLEPPLGRLWDVTLNELLYQVTDKPKRVTLKLNMRSTEVLPQAFGVLMVALTEGEAMMPSVIIFFFPVVAVAKRPVSTRGSLLREDVLRCRQPSRLTITSAAPSQPNGVFANAKRTPTVATTKGGGSVRRYVSVGGRAARLKKQRALSCRKAGKPIRSLRRCLAAVTTRLPALDAGWGEVWCERLCSALTRVLLQSHSLQLGL